MPRRPKLKLVRLKADYQDLNGHLLASAGVVVEVVRSTHPNPDWKWECSAYVGRRGVGIWLWSDKELKSLTTPLDTSRIPENRFKNEEAFLIALILDPEETTRQLMERKVDEWLQDSREDAVGCLTRWCMDGLDLGDIDTLIGIAENQFEEQT